MLNHVSEEDHKIAETIRKRYQLWFILLGVVLLLWFSLPFFLIVQEELFGTNSVILDQWLEYTPSMAPVVFGILFTANFFFIGNLALRQWKKILKSRGISVSDYNFDLSWSERLEQRGWYILARSYFHQVYPQHSPVYALHDGNNRTWLTLFLSITPQNRWAKLPAELEFDLQYADLWKRGWDLRIIISLVILSVVSVVLLFISILTPELGLDTMLEMTIFLVLFFVFLGALILYTSRFEIRSEKKIKSILVQNDVTYARTMDQKLIQLIEDNFEYKDLSLQS
jgi:hypothetical protein